MLLQIENIYYGSNGIEVLACITALGGEFAVSEVVLITQ